MVDVLYGEEIQSREAFEFFRHLTACAECEAEYLELMDTRELLAKWEDPVAEEVVKKNSFIRNQWNFSGISWFSLLQKVAAGFLMVLGLFVLLQYTGILPQENSRTMLVSDEQLAQMIHDVMVEKQVEDWKVIGTALLSLKEEIEMQNKLGIQSVYQDMDELRQRYILALEENNRHVSKLVNQ
jgi:hypothetical protein